MAGDFENMPSLAAAEKAPLNERAKTIEADAQQVKPLGAELLAATDRATGDAEIARLRETLAASQDRVKFLEAKLLARTAELATIYASTSWRLMAPLRRLGGVARWFVRGSWGWLTFQRSSRPRRIVRGAVLRIVKFVLARPSLTRIVRRPLERFPPLKSFQRRAFNVLLAASNNFAPVSDGFFSEREQFVHARLKAALEKRAG